MKIGKVSRAVLDRSVFRPLRKAGAAGEQVRFGMDAGICPPADPDTGADMLSSMCCGTVMGAFDLTPEMIIASSVNSMAAAGGICTGIQTGIVFPSSWPEEKLKVLCEKTARFASANMLAVTGGHTQISGAVSRPVLSVTGTGVPIPAGETAASSGIGQQIGLRRGGTPGEPLCRGTLYMSGYAGWAGTSLLVKEGSEAFKNRFPARMLREAEHFEDSLLISAPARCAWENGAAGMHDISQGGVFGALWEMSEYTGCGFTVDLRKIPIRQETIEICEWYDLNPYQLFGQGAMLFWTDCEEQVEAALRREGFWTVPIGYLTDSHDKTIINGEERRSLEKPQQDMIWKMQEV